MELEIDMRDERYCIGKEAQKYIKSDYPFLLNPQNQSELVGQFYIDPMFEIKTDKLGERVVNYVQLSQQQVEFGEIMDVVFNEGTDPTSLYKKEGIYKQL